jgi:hypothetical protein
MCFRDRGHLTTGAVERAPRNVVVTAVPTNDNKNVSKGDADRESATNLVVASDACEGHRAVEVREHRARIVIDCLCKVGDRVSESA